ncbi:MAG: HDOD domain-containing protein, partial [Pseudomonadota bacterium]
DQLYPKLSDEIETTALMHDMGMLVLASNFPDSYVNIIKECGVNDDTLIEAEEKIYGIDHDHILEFLAPILRLPTITTQTILNFHSSDALTKIMTVEHKHQVICHLAHIIVQKHENYISGSKGLNEILPHDLDGLAILLNLSDNQLNDIIEDSQMILDIL